MFTMLLSSLFILLVCSFYYTNAKFKIPSTLIQNYKHNIKSITFKNIILSTALAFNILPKLSYSLEDDVLVNNNNNFYEQYPYQKPIDILKFIYENSKKGSPDSVLIALDIFHSNYPMYNLTPQKAKILTNAINQHINNKLILELGTFFGYSAINICKTMPSNCYLICVEANSDNCYVAKQILEYAFGINNPILNRILLINDLSSNVINKLNPTSILTSLLDNSTSKNLGLHLIQLDDITTTINNNININKDNTTAFDVVFLDHDKNCYKIDLEQLVKKDFLTNNALVIADNVIFPGSPGYLEYVIQ